MKTIAKESKNKSAKFKIKHCFASFANFVQPKPSTWFIPKS